MATGRLPMLHLSSRGMLLAKHNTSACSHLPSSDAEKSRAAPTDSYITSVASVVIGELLELQALPGSSQIERDVFHEPAPGH